MRWNFTWEKTNLKSYDGPGKAQVSDTGSYRSSIMMIVMIPRAVDVNEMAGDGAGLQNNRKPKLFKTLILNEKNHVPGNGQFPRKIIH